MGSDESPKKSCPASHAGFNFCFWAKLLVAIPALPIIGLTAASFFETWWMQLIAGAVAIEGALFIARWIDRIPALQKKVRG